MFRERVAHWARILDFLPTAINTVAVLTRVKAASGLVQIYRSGVTAPQVSSDPRREMAIAHVQVSRLNR